MAIASYLKTYFIALSSLFIIANPATAQLIPDNTLGRENSRIMPTNNSNRNNIDGGATRGVNLFHSFQEFNINSGREVYFNNPAGVENILTRVTGGNVSNILGTLGVNGNANLYLINPNGIFFGNNAKLDLRGSFVGTTADGIELGTNGFYSATNPSSSNLLSVQPGALFTNAIRNTPRTITNQGKLQVDSLQNLTLSADTINNNGSLIAPGGNIILLATNGDILTKTLDTSDGINGGGNIFLSATNNIAINRLINASGIDFTIDSSKNFQFLSRNISKSGNVTLLAGNNISLNTDSFLISDGIFGGAINLESGNNLTVNNGIIESDSFGNISGKGGDITIKANAIALVVQNDLGLFRTGISSETTGAANAGNININTHSLRLDRAAISASTIGSNSLNTNIGDGGNININAKEIELIGVSNKTLFFFESIVSNSFFGGNAGVININTENLSLINGALISTSASFGSTKNSGTIRIFADNINLNFGVIIANNFGTAADGNIIIKANSLNLDMSAISNTSRTAIGGNIQIDLNEIFTLSNGSVIAALDASLFENIIFNLNDPNFISNLDRRFFTSFRGGGNVTINSPLIITFPSNNFIVADGFRGDGGNININTNSIFGYPQSLTITADSELAIDGEVNINGLDNNITREAIALPTSPLSAEKIIANDPCEYKNDAIARGSSFTIIGKGGIPPNPLKSLEEDRPIVEWSKSKNLDPIAPSHKQIDRTFSAKVPIEKQAIQAVGWWRKPDGTIVLTANPTKARSLDRPLFHPHCQQK